MWFTVLLGADVVLTDDGWGSVFEEFRGKLESADLVHRCGGRTTVSRTEWRRSTYIDEARSSIG